MECNVLLLYKHVVEANEITSLNFLAGVPEVTILQSNNKIQEGGNLTFECHVTGVPIPIVRWRTHQLHSHYYIQVEELYPC